MNKEKALKILKKAKEASTKRNFTQSYDLIVNLKDIDLKKTNNHVDFFTTMHFSKGKKIKVCALVGPELKDEAKHCDFAITAEEFDRYAGKIKEIKQLIAETKQKYSQYHVS